MKTCTKIVVTSILCLLAGYSLPESRATAAVMNDYCNIPPFVAQSVPPLVLLTAGRDHKLYYEAFNEAMDLDEDGRVDIGYMHNIDYYGYFDSYKCYTYDNSSSGLFSPVATTTDKFCSSGQWSGNVLNWLTMSRMDVLRKVLYGGHRSTDTTSSTILERVYVPGDAHSWGKEIPGGLCGNGSVFKNTCLNNSDCDAGYTCTDKSQNLIGMARADNSVCPASAVTWSSTTAGKIMVANFWAQAGGATNGPTHADLLNSFYTDATNNTVSPLSLIDMAASGNPSGTSTKVKYITNFNDAAVDPATVRTDYTNLLAVTAFTTANDSNLTGIWQFAVDGDDGVEIEILPANRLPANPANWIVANYYGGHGACFLPSATSNPNNKAFCSTTQSSLNNGFFNTTLTGKVWSKKLTACTAAVDTISGTASDGYCVNGGISLAKNTKYFMIVRQTNGVSNAGMRVWYRKPLGAPSSWNIFGANSDLTLSSPTIASGNECSIRFKKFVDTAETTTGENRQHLFCSTTRSVAGTPLLRLLKNRIERKWNWASKERPDCADVIRKIDDSADITLSVDTAKSDVTKIWDYTIRDEVCKDISPDNRPSSKQDASASGKETNCRPYKSGTTTIYKPAGLLQKYGEGDGTKVCSRTFSKTCTTDADCTNTPASGSNPAVFEGLCIDRAPMYFGLMTGSYVKNLSGGVLRKDIWSLSDEINMATGQYIVPPSSSVADYNTTFPQGAIIPTFEALRTVGFQYSDNSYQDTSSGNNGGPCGWIVNNPLPEGNCRMWGNPIGEMMYEGLRFLSGKTSPTASFIDTVAQDGSLPIYRQDWGVVRGSNTYHTYGDKDNNYPIFPGCSKPFMLVLSDESVSYDSDSIPGSKFNTFAEDAGLPKLNIDVGALTDTIGASVATGGEGIDGSDVFIGQADTLNDFMCTSKGPSSTPSTATKLSLMRGLCSEEPTKQGSYYSAGVAYYGKTQLTLNTQQLNVDGSIKVTGKPNVNTYSVVLTSPVPKMNIRVNGKTVTLVPIGKSTSGGGVENSCSSKCSLNINALGSLVISGCSTPATPTTAGSFCPTNQIVDFYVDTVLYDNTNAPPYTSSNPEPNITYAKFRINFEDVEQGADHDMDAISTFEICTGATCSPALTDSDQVKVSVSSDYAAGGINQVMGFVISGTSEDATYLVVRDSDSSTSCTSNPGACNLPLDWEHTFNVTSTGATANLLHNPLWYAAKWGGFSDGNGNNKPDIRGEWAKNCTKTNITDCDPDNYYLVVNPLKLEQQLDKALTDILTKTSSGTAASIVNNSGESGTNILQALYFPQRDFSGTKVSWIGELQNMWYYLDPRIMGSAIREDTINDKILNLDDDLIAEITFDDSKGKTVVNRKNNKGIAVDQIELDDLNSLWRAGELLHHRNLTLTPRSIKTSIDGSNLIDFSSSSSTLQNYLQAANLTEASKIINYVIGNDTPSDLTLRNRTVTYKGKTGPWRLGDIISSTPKIQGGTPMQGYDLDYNDNTYKSFWGSIDYKKRNMVYAGSNDGMLHAFTLGVTTKLNNISTPINVAKILPDTSPPLGQEEWAFIPKNALPYLRYQMQPDYSHLYTIDGKIRLIDVSINAPTSSLNSDSVAPCDSAHYWNCLRKTTLNLNEIVEADTSWRTVLIGGMGLGGASRPSSGTCASSTPSSPSALPDCVKTPIATPTGYENAGLSSYYALDVTTPSNPSILWEFTSPDLGYTLSQPAIVRINGKKGGGGTTNNDPDTSKNGRWFAIFASGPTGPINTVSHQFYGKSDQNLKLFIVDIKTGQKWTKDTGISNAFGGLFGTASAVDTDAWNKNDQGYKDASNTVLDPKGYYSTDAVYLGYTNYNTTDSKWDGGVGRLVTKEDTDPDHWVWRPVIEKIGPVTTSIAMLQDNKSKKLWLYFGAGRYFYKDATGIDDPDERRYLYGIPDPCYPRGSGMTAINDLDVECVDKVDVNDLEDMSDKASSTANKGWKIILWGSWSQFKAERLLTNPTALYTGNVVFTTFQPTADVCGYGGQTFIWVVDGKSGGTASESSLKGQQLYVQLTTGAFVKVNFDTDLLARLHRRTGLGVGDQLSGDNRDETAATKGLGGTGNDESKILKQPKGVPRILHYKER